MLITMFFYVKDFFLKHLFEEMIRPYPNDTLQTGWNHQLIVRT